MRRERLYLLDVVAAADAIDQFLEEVDEDTFLGSDLLQSAVLQKLTVIGEAAARLPQEFRARHPKIEWRDIVAFRNIAIHRYFAVDFSIVWTTATADVPSLRQQITRIVQEEFPSEDSQPWKSDSD